MVFRRISVIFLFLAIGSFLASCASNKVIPERAMTVAVWDLDDVSPLASGTANLGDLLSAQIIEVLKKKGEYTVVERERLLLALGELHLGTTSLVDDSTRLRLGKLVGARRMIFGGYQIVGEQMRLDLRLVDIESGRVVKAVKKTTAAGDLSGWLEAAKEAALEL